MKGEAADSLFFQEEVLMPKPNHDTGNVNHLFKLDGSLMNDLYPSIDGWVLS